MVAALGCSVGTTAGVVVCAECGAINWLEAGRVSAVDPIVLRQLSTTPNFWATVEAVRLLVFQSIQARKAVLN